MKEIMQDVGLGHMVKVAVLLDVLGTAEAVWLRVLLRSSTYWVGSVIGKPQFIPMKQGDFVRFCPLNIYAYETVEVPEMP